jgi:hypothetical protein
MKKRMTIRLADGLLKQAKGMAVANGRSLNSLIVEGVQIALADDRKADTHKRVPTRQQGDKRTGT